MAWIESHQELDRHPKTKRLARELKESIPSVIGRLHLLWWWALDYAPDGSLEKFDVYDISDALLWDGDPVVLRDALVSSGWIDEDMYIHDWHEYAGRLVEKRQQNAERKRRSRSKSEDVTRTSRGQDEDVSVSHGATVPNTTQHNTTVQNTTDTEKPEKRARVKKVKCSEFVFLTEDELKKLEEEFGENGVRRLVEILNNYKGATGKTYKSDYLAIRNWVIKRYEEEQTKGATLSSGNKVQTGLSSIGSQGTTQQGQKDERYSAFYELFPDA